MRSEHDIIVDLEKLSQEEGFVYTFSTLAFTSLWAAPEEYSEIDWTRRPNHQELAFLLGLMAKHPITLASPPTEDLLGAQWEKAVDLLNELHTAYSSSLDNSFPWVTTDHSIEKGSDTEEPTKRLPITGRRMTEAIFYGEEVAHESQYLEMALERYASDSDWIEEYLGCGLDAIVEISLNLRDLLREKAQRIEYEESLAEFCGQFLKVFSFRLDELREVGENAKDAFIKNFCVVPGGVNPDLFSIGSRNSVLTSPVLQIDDESLFFPIQFYLAKSIYESPSYWMSQDIEYEKKRAKNRGSATEELTYGLLKGVFGERNTYRNVHVKRGKKDVNEIDVLAVKGNKAVVVQCKSKRLTVESRKGADDQLLGDFEKAVQGAYEQALLSRQAVIDPEVQLFSTEGQPIKLEESIDDAYIICVTGDHYPVLPLHVAIYLRKEEIDPHPIVLSIFELDIICFYLHDPIDLLYYLRQRTKYADRYRSISEKALLGYHLKQRLLPPDNEYTIAVDQDVAQLIDSDFAVAKRFLPEHKGAREQLNGWQNPDFQDLVRCLRGMHLPELTDAIFLLCDLAGSRADSILDGFARIRKRTLTDGKIHDLCLQISGHRRGISFLSFPEPLNEIQCQSFLNRIKVYVVSKKYKSYADEWLTFASLGGSPHMVDVALYDKASWNYDKKLENMAEDVFGTAKGVNLLGGRSHRKTSRNEPCPCGSGIKYKRCHGR